MKTREGGFRWYDRATFNDGFSVSIQASEYHYCTPRITFDEPYSAVELGFPSHGDPLIQPYAEEPRKCRKTVYGYVPASVVRALIEKHGGIKAGECPPLVTL